MNDDNFWRDMYAAADLHAKMAEMYLKVFMGFTLVLTLTVIVLMGSK